MKKLTAILLALVMLIPMAFAQGIHEPGTGIENPELREEAQGTGQGLNATEREQAAAAIGQQIAEQLRYELRKQTAEGVRQIVRERRQLMEQEVGNITDRARQRAFQNQNEVRLAVHALMEMDNITGGIGPQVREVARNFNNSIQATLRAEERVESRGGFARFFAGGDFESAAEMEQEVSANRERIQQLKQLRDQCPCDEEVKTMLQEQIQQMEQEQDRLQGLAQAERKSKGLLGWIWK
ncbi:hypothetical protein KY343_06210 [Candidatus Woesearchaeota archaeon]|nr:hypothetical protein [Candidatus Woesearchaeota archaeon]